MNLSTTIFTAFDKLRPPRGVLPEKLGGGVQPASQNPNPIYDQDLRYSLPYLWPDQKLETLFLTSVIISSLVQTNVKLP